MNKKTVIEDLKTSSREAIVNILWEARRIGDELTIQLCMSELISRAI